MINDIRIGTLAGIATAPKYISQILHHGFESYQLTGGFGVGLVDFDTIAKQTLDVIGDTAVVSALGYYGNPLGKPEDTELFAAYIDACPAFGCDLITGFAGALPDKSMPDCLPAFKTTWTELAKRAAGIGVRIAFENCDMGGRWHRSGDWNIAHAPAMWDRMFDVLSAHDNVGLCWEPCHQLNSLVDPIANLRKYIGRVLCVHGKDATVAWDVIRDQGLNGGVPYVWSRTPGFGDTNWTDVITILRQHRFKGFLDIEGWHDPVYRGDLEMTGQVHALNYLKRCRGGDVFVPNPVV